MFDRLVQSCCNGLHAVNELIFNGRIVISYATLAASQTANKVQDRHASAQVPEWTCAISLPCCRLLFGTGIAYSGGEMLHAICSGQAESSATERLLLLLLLREFGMFCRTLLGIFPCLKTFLPSG